MAAAMLPAARQPAAAAVAFVASADRVTVAVGGEGAGGTARAARAAEAGAVGDTLGKSEGVERGAALVAGAAGRGEGE